MIRLNQIRPRTRVLLMGTALSGLMGCTAVSSDQTLAPSDAQSVTSSELITGLEHFEFGNRTSSAWVSDSFDGTRSRQFIGEELHFTVEQFAADGGLDVGVSDVHTEPAPVESAKSDLYVCSSYSVELSGAGRWWAGPKISVNWQGEESAKQNGDDWYENYIVEIASSSPQELHDLFTGDYFQAEELSPIVLSGAMYRNYKIRFHDWWQFWSVRQEYRETGMVPIEPIIDTWIANGLPTERLFDGVKANIETYGPISGRGALRFETSGDPILSACDATTLLAP